MKDISQQAKHYIDQLSLSVETINPLVTPLTASLQANKWCNSRCEYCGIWKNTMGNPLVEDLFQAVDELSDIGVHMVSLTGGEPFLNNDLSQVIQRISDRQMISSTMTNGLLLNPKHVEPILEAGLNSLCVSLDSIDPGIYKSIRGVSLEPVLKGLKFIANIRSRYPSLFVFSVNCVISRANIDSVDDLVVFCNDFDISVGFQPLHRSFESRYNPEMLQFHEGDLSHLHKQIEKLIQMKKNGSRIDNSELYLRGFPDFLVYKRLPEGTICTAGFTTISVDVDLNVRSCWPKKPIGNLHSQKLMEMWHSQLYSQNRASMLALDCPKCWLRCHTDYLSVQWLMNLMEKILKAKTIE
jgi:MoaA/NifB/PqqE/SkfB family radical SAM enzyme